MSRLNSDLRKEIVPAARLSDGRWNFAKQITEGERDISASYSADLIGMQNTCRAPFKFSGALWVVTSGWGGIADTLGAEAYRIVSKELFEDLKQGKPTTYHEKCRDVEAAQNDPNGFYHGMTVKRGGNEFVLCGPPVQFISSGEAIAPPEPEPETKPEPDISKQGSLF